MLIYVIAEDPINFSRPAVVKSQFGTLSGKPRELVLAERLDGKLIISKRASTSKPSCRAKMKSRTSRKIDVKMAI